MDPTVFNILPTVFGTVFKRFTTVFNSFLVLLTHANCRAGDAWVPAPRASTPWQLKSREHAAHHGSWIRKLQNGALFSAHLCRFFYAMESDFEKTLNMYPDALDFPRGAASLDTSCRRLPGTGGRIKKAPGLSPRDPRTPPSNVDFGGAKKKSCFRFNIGSGVRGSLGERPGAFFILPPVWARYVFLIWRRFMHVLAPSIAIDDAWNVSQGCVFCTGQQEIICTCLCMVCLQLAAKRCPDICSDGALFFDSPAACGKS
jgi:hypothetical protein